MKKILALLFVTTFFTSNVVFAAVVPKMIDGMSENDFILNEMLPNPSVYLYGVDSNGFPILLMNFSLTIPVYAIDDNPWLRLFQAAGRIAPTFHKKVKSLKNITLYLKLNPSKETADGKKFYYKIVKLQCDEEDQGLKYHDTSEWRLHAEGGYSQGGGSGKGTIDRNMIREINYESKLPIRNYSGVGSDTLKITLKRGRKYPIRAGHMNISMVVTAIPYYKNPPLNYCALRCNGCNYDFVKDYMTDINPECPCTEIIRKIYFTKIYRDNSMMNYYELNPYRTAGVILDSEVIMGNRINGCPILAFQRTTTERICKDLNKYPCDPCPASTANVAPAQKGPDCAQGATAASTTTAPPDRVCGSPHTEINDLINKTVSRCDSYGMILDDGQFMYDNIFKKQLPNTESVSPAADNSVNATINAVTPTATSGTSATDNPSALKMAPGSNEDRMAIPKNTGIKTKCDKCKKNNKCNKRTKCNKCTKRHN